MDPSDKILRPGSNVWKVARAARAAPLVDGGAYFRAVRQALLNARHSVFIVGWDIHSQMRLVGETGRADDGYPEELAPFLSELVERRPGLHLHIVLWNFAILYAGEREWLPRWRLNWALPNRVHFCLDSAVPLGASQHQKLIVVDDAIAFSGGLDLTIRRWDTPAHRLDEARRVDPDGKPYPPFHDVQFLVDSGPARALAEIARNRWRLSGGTPAPDDSPPNCDPWPESVAPAFTDVDVGVARTRPAFRHEEEVREVERLFLDSIDGAQRLIYLENQFLTYTGFAERLCRALKRNKRLEAIFIAPQAMESWIEAHTMRNGRIRFARVFAEAGMEDRVRFLCPAIPDGHDCIYPMIHSKVMTVDDRLLRIGSANLNYRSMGTDAECDLALEADRPAVRRQIADVRNDLIAEHCGCGADEFAEHFKRTGSAIAAVDELGCKRGRLRKIDDGTENPGGVAIYLEKVADSERPIGYEAFKSLSDLHKREPLSPELLLSGLAVLIVGALAVLWYFAPLLELADPNAVRLRLMEFAHSVWAPVIVVGAFLIASLVAFPINILIIGSAAAFGPWFGLAYSTVGVSASAILTYAIGRWAGRKLLSRVLGEKLSQIRKRIAEQGIIAVAAIRLVPIAPFTIVNLAAGAGEIKALDYIIGTLLGLAPGLVVMSFLGDQATDVLAQPSASNIVMLATAIMLWIGIVIGAQILVTKYWDKAT